MVKKYLFIATVICFSWLLTSCGNEQFNSKSSRLDRDTTIYVDRVLQFKEDSQFALEQALEFYFFDSILDVPSDRRDRVAKKFREYFEQENGAPLELLSDESLDFEGYMDPNFFTEEGFQYLYGFDKNYPEDFQKFLDNLRDYNENKLDGKYYDEVESLEYRLSFDNYSYNEMFYWFELQYIQALINKIGMEKFLEIEHGPTMHLEGEEEIEQELDERYAEWLTEKEHEFYSSLPTETAWLKHPTVYNDDGDFMSLVGKSYLISDEENLKINIYYLIDKTADGIELLDKFHLIW